jgi:hypothetical protein
MANDVEVSKDGKRIKWRKYTDYKCLDPTPPDYGAAMLVKYGDVSPRPNTYATRKAISSSHGHSHSHEINTPPISSEVENIASKIAAEIAKEVDARVSTVLEDGGKDEWIAWFQNENENLRQRVEELEIELADANPRAYYLPREAKDTDSG